MKKILSTIFLSYGVQKMIITFILALVFAVITDRTGSDTMWTITVILLILTAIQMLIGIVFAWIVPLFKKTKDK